MRQLVAITDPKSDEIYLIFTKKLPNFPIVARWVLSLWTDATPGNHYRFLTAAGNGVPREEITEIYDITEVATGVCKPDDA